MSTSAVAVLCLFVGAGFGLSVAAFFFAWRAYSERKYTADEAQALVNQAYRAGTLTATNGLPMIAPSVPTEPQRAVDSIESTRGPVDSTPFGDDDDIDPADAYEYSLRLHQSRAEA